MPRPHAETAPTFQHESFPRIEAIEVIEVRVPRRASNLVTTSYGTLPDAQYALVTVQAGGVTGIGEAPTEEFWTGEDAASVRNAIETYLAPLLVGKRQGIRETVRQMNSVLAQNPYAKAAIEMALWDLLGKLADLPLHVLLGGGSARPVPIKYVIGVTDPEHARQEALAAKKLGFSFLKVKVGTDLESDLERVRAVAEVLEPGERVGVDANTGWSTITTLAAIGPLVDMGVAFLEQPVSPHFPGAMADITARSPIPVIAHESVVTLSDAIRAASERAAHIWAVTPGTHGGIVPTLDILSIARAHGIPCLIGSTFELGVATALMAHMGSAFDEIFCGPVPSDAIGPLYVEDDIITEPLRLEGGHIYVPNGPGLGVELDLERVETFRVK